MTEHVCFHHVTTGAHFSSYHVTRTSCKNLRLKGNCHKEMGYQYHLTMLQPTFSFSPRDPWESGHTGLGHGELLW